MAASLSRPEYVKCGVRFTALLPVGVQEHLTLYKDCSHLLISFSGMPVTCEIGYLETPEPFDCHYKDIYCCMFDLALYRSLLGLARLAQNSVWRKRFCREQRSESILENDNCNGGNRQHVSVMPSVNPGVSSILPASASDQLYKFCTTAILAIVTRP